MRKGRPKYILMALPLSLRHHRTQEETKSELFVFRPISAIRHGFYKKAHDRFTQQRNNNAASAREKLPRFSAADGVRASWQMLQPHTVHRFLTLRRLRPSKSKVQPRVQVPYCGTECRRQSTRNGACTVLLSQRRAERPPSKPSLILMAMPGSNRAASFYGYRGIVVPCPRLRTNSFRWVNASREVCPSWTKDHIPGFLHRSESHMRDYCRGIKSLFNYRSDSSSDANLVSSEENISRRSAMPSTIR